ncbi:MAG: A/G-specific adenine glycosylase [Waddliaceae bacterium]
MNSLDLSPVKAWFQREKRSLPWREDSSPYAIWVSEVMLQQTQVKVVIPYFQRWMEAFPTISALAAASIDQVIKQWEGLGYYARARNLHKGAKFVLENYQGVLPKTKEALLKIPGLGPYTVAAILNFAFHQKSAAVDGNVLRVMTRLLGIEEDISKVSTVNAIRAQLESLLPDCEPWIVSEALIELGAIVCKKLPKCELCPMHRSCKANLSDKQKTLPFNSRKTLATPLHRAALIISHEDHYLVQRGEKGRIMADLHYFPFIEMDFHEICINEIHRRASSQFSLDLTPIRKLPPFSHSFTRYQVTLTPCLFLAQEMPKIDGFKWSCDLKSLAFCSGHREIAKRLSAGMIPFPK